MSRILFTALNVLRESEIFLQLFYSILSMLKWCNALIAGNSIITDSVCIIAFCVDSKICMQSVTYSCVKLELCQGIFSWSALVAWKISATCIKYQILRWGERYGANFMMSVGNYLQYNKGNNMVSSCQLHHLSMRRLHLQAEDGF